MSNLLELTVADLATKGIDNVDVRCNSCGRTWPALISILPDQTTLRKVSALLSCPTCGSSDIDLETDWPAAPTSH